jgi:hypothetical protein
MRSFFVGVVLLTAVVGLLGGPPEEPTADRVARLVKQLGHDEFSKREEASEELDAIGEPALDALRKAAASDPDPEIGSRAERILNAIVKREGKRLLAPLAGSWNGPDGLWMKLDGENWSFRSPNYKSAGVMWVSGADRATLRVEYAIHEGPNKGRICKGLLRLDGDKLHYCATFDDRYPTEFKTVGNDYSCVFQREQ